MYNEIGKDGARKDKKWPSCTGRKQRLLDRTGFDHFVAIPTPQTLVRIPRYTWASSVSPYGPLFRLICSRDARLYTDAFSDNCRCSREACMLCEPISFKWPAFPDDWCYKSRRMGKVCWKEDKWFLMSPWTQTVHLNTPHASWRAAVGPLVYFLFSHNSEKKHA